jgi:alcohol dehydrogenase class IV
MFFEFATASRIIFGPGKLREIGKLSKQIGHSALIVSGLAGDLPEKLVDFLFDEGIESQIFRILTEPSISMVLEGIKRVEESNFDLIIGFGGGSAIDAGKAIAALYTNPGNPMDYIEVIGRGQALRYPPLPFIAIPTTAGTGAEVTRNAVLSSPENRVKVSLRSALMLPKLAIIDPELTLSLPPAITASTGLDALTQCIEPFVTHFTNPITDGICRQGVQFAARSLRKAFEYSDNLEARIDMSLASLFGGLALANAKLGAVHGFAGPLGGMYPNIPHGVICGRLLPFVVETNVNALSAREPESPALSRYKELAKIITGNTNARANDVVYWINDLVNQLEIPSLSKYGIAEKDYHEIIEKSKQASSMKGNPIKLTDNEYKYILDQACN